MKKLCDYLLDECRSQFGPQELRNIIKKAPLGEDESRLLESFWIEQKSYEVIAFENRISASEVQRILKKATKPVKETFYNETQQSI